MVQKIAKKSAVAMVKETKNLGCVFQTWSRRSLQRYFTEELNHAETEPKCSIHQNHTSLSQSSRPKSIAQQKKAQANLISEPRTLQNLRIGLRKRHNDKSTGLAKQRGIWQRKSSKLMEKKKTTVFSPTEKWCLPSPSKIKAEEREFVVDSGASMHMISRKGSKFRRIGDCDDFQVSDDSHNSQWRSADA